MNPNQRIGSPMVRDNYYGTTSTQITNGRGGGNVIGNHETRVCIVIDSRGPISMKIPLPPEQVTLADFKMASQLQQHHHGNNNDTPTYKYFFKTEDSDFGIVKEEISDDYAILPMFKGRIVAWVITNNIANISQGHDGDIDHISECSQSLDTTSDNNRYYHYLQQQQRQQQQRRHNNDSSQHVIYDRCGHAESNSNISESTSFLDSDTTATSDDDNTFIDSHHSYRSASHLRRDREDGQRQYNISNEFDNTNAYSTTMNNTNTINSSSHLIKPPETRYMNLVTVQLNLNDFNLLGIGIVGKSNEANNIDGGIYVGEIKPNSIVAQDGRIQSGDMLVQINNINITGMTNERAVEILREAVQRSGPLKLVVAKCHSAKSTRGHFTIAHDQVFSLIDTAAWVANSAKQSNSKTLEYPNNCRRQFDNTIHPSSATAPRPSSAVDEAISSGNNSNMRKFNIRLGGSLRSSYDRCSQSSPTMHKDNIDIIKVVQRMMLPTSGLEVKDREWLKITIPKAFLGSDVVQWLEKNVSGFQNKRDIKNYASRMLELGYFRNLISSKSFSEQCYYVFANNILSGGLPI